MSMYNLAFGSNPIRPLIMKYLEIENISVRLRDASLFTDMTKIKELMAESSDYPDMIIRVITRTGGGNREDYRDENTALAQHPLYIKDEDDPFDTTYANFYFRLPDKFLEDGAAYGFDRERLNRFVDNLSMEDKFNKFAEFVKNESS